jgi:hypothetical protein
MNFYEQAGISAKRKFISTIQFEDLDGASAVSAGQYEPTKGTIAIEIDVQTRAQEAGSLDPEDRGSVGIADVRAVGFVVPVRGHFIRGSLDMPVCTITTQEDREWMEECKWENRLEQVLAAIRQKIGAARFDGNELEH